MSSMLQDTTRRTTPLHPREPRTSRDFPTWHFSMLNDHARNDAIDKAIRSLNVTGKTVVEIGTGSGIIALLFARAGARRVLTCEMNPRLAELATSIISKTMYSDVIDVIPYRSTDAIRLGFLPQNPDFIFTETLDCGVIGEGYFDIARDIRYLTGPKTKVLPQVIFQHGMLVHSPQMYELNAVTDVCGFDLRELNKYSTRHYFSVRSQLFHHEPLAHSNLLRTYDYLTDGVPEIQQHTINKTGVLHGMLSWFKAPFQGIEVTNEPGTLNHWHQAFHPLPEPLPVKKGQKLNVQILDNGVLSVT